MKQDQRNEIQKKLIECEKRMDDLAWGIRTNEDFIEFGKWSNKANLYRKALAKLN